MMAVPKKETAASLTSLASSLSNFSILFFTSKKIVLLSCRREPSITLMGQALESCFSSSRLLITVSKVIVLPFKMAILRAELANFFTSEAHRKVCPEVFQEEHLYPLILV